MVKAEGSCFLMLLYPKAIHTSSAISHSCKISDLKGGTDTFTLSWSKGVAPNYIFLNKVHTCS